LVAENTIRLNSKVKDRAFSIDDCRNSFFADDAFRDANGNCKYDSAAVNGLKGLSIIARSNSPQKCVMGDTWFVSHSLPISDFFVFDPRRISALSRKTAAPEIKSHARTFVFKRKSTKTLCVNKIGGSRHPVLLNSDEGLLRPNRQQIF